MKVCIRRQYERASVAVSECYLGFTYNDALAQCVASPTHGADCQGACSGNINKACPSFCPPEKSYCCKEGEGPDECRLARYVDLSLSQGSSKDYFQCVSPAVNAFSASVQDLSAGNVGNLLEVEEKNYSSVASTALFERA